MRLFLLLLLMACSHSSSDIKVNLYAKKVMDIELPSKNIIPHCTIPKDPAKINSWLGIYIFYNNRVEWLHERRQHLPKDCEKERDELLTLLKKSRRARVIGIESSDNNEDSDLAIILNDPTIRSVDRNWKFSRLITAKGCFGWEGCEDPRLVEKDDYENIYE